ncbi:MAG: hypothetical protein IKG80_06810 [Clostridia bacterium]|nr:hypothetical protein [Clostridia bacterium]
MMSSFFRSVVRLSSVTELSMNAMNLPSSLSSTANKSLPVRPVSFPDAAASRAAETSSSRPIRSFLPVSTDSTSPFALNLTE